MTPELRALIDAAPPDPGVYRFLDVDGRVIYVGKAKSLRSRVRSYFREGGDGRLLLEHLREAIHSVDFIVTETEKEALLLENTLIKRHRPTFNINFRDDKSFVSIRVDPDSEIPRLQVVRKPREDGALYFGPYSSSSAVRVTMKFLGRHFGVRPCSDGFYRAHARRACLKYQIGRCRAPCCGHIDLDEHRRLAREVALFLRGRRGELVKDLERKMKVASQGLDFERAATLRDQAAAVRQTIEGQIVTRTLSGELDILGLHREGGRLELALLFVREGSLVSTRCVPFLSELPSEDVVSSFLSQYYASGNLVPGAVVVPLEIPDSEMIEALLTERRGRNVRLHVARKGERKRLLELARRNAEASFRSRQRLEREMGQSLTALQKALSLPRLPRRIEGFDVSTFQGRETVASMVVLIDGRPSRDDYRRFRIRGEDARDDFSALRQAISRRARALVKEGDAPPDLIVVDGGRGQLAAAASALADAELSAIPVVSLAKARTLSGKGDPVRSDERVFVPGAEVPVPLSEDRPEHRLVVHLRDEAHRFAIAYHRKLRGRASVRSDLDAIQGIGPQRKRALLRAFGSVEGIRGAALEDVARTSGIGVRRARFIQEELRRLRDEVSGETSDDGAHGTT